MKMGLIIERVLYEGIISPPEGAENVYLNVQKQYLSRYYDLHNNSKIDGEILDINKSFGDLRDEEQLLKKEIPGKDISFILKVLSIGTDDYIFIFKESWNKFKDYGIFPSQFKLKVKLNSASFDGETIQLFPKRDITA
jgi:hypothetical protein